MRIIIDDRKVVGIRPFVMKDDGGADRQLVRESDAYDILWAWKTLDPDARTFRYGRDDGDTDPGVIFVAQALPVGGGARLVFSDIDPFWSLSTDTLNAYILDDIVAATGGHLVGDE